MAISVLVRADGGAAIGGGHIVRAKIICGALRSEGFDPHLLTKEDSWTRSALQSTAWTVHVLRPGENESLVVEKAIRRLAARVVVLDVRDTSAEYVRYLKETGARVVTIDDPGAGAGLADAAFRGGVAPRREKNMYFGPDYSILAPDISAFREQSRPPAAAARAVCFLGTFDAKHYGRWLPEAAAAFPRITFEWFGGGGSPECPLPNLRIMDLSHPAFFQSLVSADFAVVSGGVCLFESLAIGRPALVLAQAPHESDQAVLFSSMGAAVPVHPPTAARLIEEIRGLADEPSRLADLHHRALAAVDGRGLERFLALIRTLAR